MTNVLHLFTLVLDIKYLISIKYYLARYITLTFGFRPAHWNSPVSCLMPKEGGEEAENGGEEEKEWGGGETPGPGGEGIGTLAPPSSRRLE